MGPRPYEAQNRAFLWGHDPSLPHLYLSLSLSLFLSRGTSSFSFSFFILYYFVSIFSFASSLWVMEMGDQYGLPDLRQFMARTSHFPAVPHPTEPFLHHYEAIMVGSHMGELVDFHADHSATANAPASASASATASATAAASASASAFASGLEMECCGFGGGGGGGGEEGGNSRWPRQETLTLLEIRSRLDPKFKEANQKGPLWAEVSRYICMTELHSTPHHVFSSLVFFLSFV